MSKDESEDIKDGSAEEEDNDIVESATSGLPLRLPAIQRREHTQKVMGPKRYDIQSPLYIQAVDTIRSGGARGEDYRKEEV